MGTIQNTDPTRYQHPLDKQALAALKKLPGIDWVMAKVLDLNISFDQMPRLKGNAALVTEQTSPRLYNLKRIANERLGIQEDIPVYIKQEWQYNAYTAGVDNPVIVLYTSLLNDMTDDEVLYILGHEMAHYQNKHTLYHYMAHKIADIAFNGGVISGMAMSAIVFALLEWYRKSELTADRGGYIANQNKSACISAMQKLMGLPEKAGEEGYNFTTEEILSQYEERDIDLNGWKEKIMYAILTLSMDHPWMVERINELSEWEDMTD